MYEKASASGASDSRAYGVWTTQADLKVVEYATGTAPTVATEYTNITGATASTTSDF